MSDIVTYYDRVIWKTKNWQQIYKQIPLFYQKEVSLKNNVLQRKNRNRHISL